MNDSSTPPQHPIDSPIDSPIDASIEAPAHPAPLPPDDPAQAPGHAAAAGASADAAALPLPDRLSTDPRSPHHVAAVFERPIGIRFNGRERSDVDEYCISEGWIRVPAGKAVDRKGRPLLLKLKGVVEAYFR